MSHGDDDDGGDDTQLRSLRAVWLSMPDEDPPERGLADLLAAARSKASEMAAETEQEPSWWQRFVAALRRPPVLALASVAVLVAGALVVSNRSMKASAPTGGAAPSTEDVPAEMHDHEKLRESAPPAAPEVPEVKQQRQAAPGGTAKTDDKVEKSVGLATDVKGEMAEDCERSATRLDGGLASCHKAKTSGHERAGAAETTTGSTIERAGTDKATTASPSD